MSTRGVRRERSDNNIINTKQMLNMDSDTIDECEYLCRRANNVWDQDRWTLEYELKEN